MTVVRVALGALAATLLTAAVPPPARALGPGDGYRLLASASAGSVFVNDPTFLVPYADQIVTSATAELSAVGASAGAAPFVPGSVVALAPTVLVVGCPTCPSVPQPVDLQAEAKPPASETDSVTATAATVGPVRYEGPRASATARVDELAESSASTSGIEGVEGSPDINSTSSATRLRAPTDADPGLAEALASAMVGAVEVVAIAKAVPTVEAVAGIRQSDGSVAPIPADGLVVGDGVLRPAVETGATSAHAGVVFERTPPDGATQRTTVVLADAQLVASEGGAAPSTAGTELVTGGFLSPAMTSDASEGTPAEVATLGAVPRHPVALAGARPPLRRWLDEHAWIVWLYLAWLCAGLSMTAAGHRWLAPRLAHRADAARRAIAAHIDHLDAGARP